MALVTLRGCCIKLYICPKLLPHHHTLLTSHHTPPQVHTPHASSMIQEGGESTESHLGSPVHPVSEAQGTGVRSSHQHPAQQQQQQQQGGLCLHDAFQRAAITVTQ